jgi:HTH-type transcriptional regulator/antitoxin HigA
VLPGREQPLGWSRPLVHCSLERRRWSPVRSPRTGHFCLGGRRTSLLGSDTPLLVQWAARLGTPRHDRLEVLATLVEDYEGKHQPIDPPDPVAAIRFRMGQGDLDRKVLEPSIGSRARVSDVLSGRRRPMLDMIRRLHRQLGIPAEVLLVS